MVVLIKILVPLLMLITCLQAIEVIDSTIEDESEIEDNLILPNMIQIYFEIKKDETSNLVIDLLSKGTYKNFTSAKVSLNTLLSAAELGTVEASTLKEILQKSNFNINEPFKNNVIEDTFKALNASFIDFYRTCVVSLVSDEDTASIMYEQLKINEIALLKATFNNDNEKFINALRVGVYSEDNMKKVLELLNKDEAEVLNIFIEEFGKLNIDSLFEVTGSEVLAQRLKEAFKILDVPSEKFYHVMEIGDILGNYSADWTKPSPFYIATAFTNESFIASDRVADILEKHDDYIEMFNEGIISESKNPLEINVNVKVSPFSVLQSKTSTNSSLAVTEDYNTLLKNCTIISQYLNLQWKIIDVEEVELSDDKRYIIANISSEPVTIDNGAPLICNNMIYGLSNDNSNFTTFYKLTKNIYHPASNPTPSTNKPSVTTEDSSSSIKYLGNFLFITLFYLLSLSI